MPPCLYTSICLYAPRGVHTPICPLLFYASVCFWRLCMLWGVVMGSLLCWDTLLYITPDWGCLPFITPPHSVIGSLCIGMFRDISMLCGHFPSVRKGLGVFPISWGWGASALEMSICSFLHLFVVALCLTFQLSSANTTQTIGEFLQLSCFQ